MAKILIVEDTPDTRNLIRIKLTKAGHEVVTAEDGEIALKQAFEHHPQLVVLDLMLPKLDGFQVARRLRQAAETRHVAILMLTAKGEISDKVQGFEAGADDYLTKPFDPSELELRVRRLLERVAPIIAAAEPAARLGQLISVFSLRGGVGKTTLAVNLAVTLAQLWNKAVPLLDLALQNGQAAIFLGVRPKATVYNLIDHWQEYPNGAALRDYFTTAPSQVQLLAAPRHPSDAERISDAMLKHIVRLIRADAPLVVADLTSQLNDQTLAVLDASDAILLMMTPEVASVDTMVELLDTFERLAYPKEKMQVVVSYTFPRRALSQAQLESAISHPVALALPYDPEMFVHAINTGEPYVLLNPTSLATRAVQDYAYKLSHLESSLGADATPLAKAVQARLKAK